MIITLKGCTATAFIGGLNFFKVSKGTVSGADVTIRTSTINKDEANIASDTIIAEVALKSGYESLSVTVTMGGSSVNNWYNSGKVTIPANTTVTGDIKISASATAVSGGEVVDPEEPGTGGNVFNNASMWVSQTISSTGLISNTGITQSNIMPKVKFKGSASVEATGIDIMMAWITYNEDGTFKSRENWITLAKGQKTEFSHDYPFTCLIATRNTNTSYSVEEMVSWINVIGTADGEGDIIYTDDESMWIQQNISSGGAITPPTDSTYNRSNIMYNGKFEKPIKVTALSENLQFAVVSYNADGSFKARGSWVSVSTGGYATATDELPFNVVIATSNESSYTLSEMLTKVKVSSSN